jgi:hypothetical protein
MEKGANAVIRMDEDFLYEIEIDDGKGRKVFPCRNKNGKFSVNLDGRSKGKDRFMSVSFDQLLQFFVDGHFQEKGTIRMKAPGDKGNGNGRSPSGPRRHSNAFISDNFQKLILEGRTREDASSVLPTKTELTINKMSSLPEILDGKEGHLAITTDAQVSLESDTRGLETDEREAVVKVRFGQGGFRDALFQEAGHMEKCWMSGIEGRHLLIASHIKPWSHCESDPDSRGRTDNGLLLSSLWDAAFDAGLVSFDSDWNIVASSELRESARNALGLDKYSVLPEKFRTTGRKTYLGYHFASVFEYWKKSDLAMTK